MIYIKLKAFRSAEKVKQAFLNGLNFYIDLYKIQSNKSRLNEFLSGATRFGYSLHHISQSSVSRALNWQKKMTMPTSDQASYVKEVLKQFLEIESKRSSSTVSSMITMVCHSLLSEASHVIITPQNHDSQAFDLTQYLKCIALVKTSHKVDLSILIKAMMILLNGANSNTFQEVKTSQITAYTDLNDQQKMQYMCYCALSKCAVEDLQKFFNEEELMLFKKIRFDTASSYIDDLAPPNSSSSTSLKTQNFVGVCASLTWAIDEYITKFAHNTGIKAPSSRSVADIGVLSAYAEHDVKNIPETEGILKGGAIGNNPVPYVISGLKAISSNIPVINQAGKVLGKLIDMVFKSEGYGWIHRHGISGQIRAYLLRYYTYNSLMLVAQEYENYMHGSGSDPINAQDRMMNIFYYIESFKNAYQAFYPYLPNAKQEGSLAFYLAMYCDPSNNNFGKPNQQKVEQWSQSKLNWHHAKNAHQKINDHFGFDVMDLF